MDQLDHYREKIMTDSITLDALNAALCLKGWHAEYKTAEPEDFTVTLFRAQGGQAHRKFDFDPADPDDNGPWGDEGAVHEFPVDAPGVERELFALCKACQE